MVICVPCRSYWFDSDVSLESCGPAQFQCGSAVVASASAGAVECIPLAWRCDGRADCSDQSDETIHCGQYLLYHAAYTNRLESDAI